MLPRSTALLLLLVMQLPTAVVSYAMFANQIPNGDKVPHPCKLNMLWKGVGHFNVDGGGNRNPFGLDFHAANKQWTAALCGKDSDGDGRTNGQELGDPDCTWTLNALPKFTTGLSHPGVCEPMNSTICQQKAFDNGLFKTQQEWMADACKSDQFVCKGLDDAAIKNQTLRIPLTPVPAKETTYMCSVFDFRDVDDDVHMIATTPIVDNHQIMHHIVLFGCKGEITDRKVGEPYQCGMSAHQNCSTILSVWTLGQNGECYHENTGIRMGVKGYKRVALQFHWNNPEKSSTFVDSSGMTLYYTSSLRPNDAAVLLIGNVDFAIPPRQERVMVESTCSSKCTQSILTEPIYITAAWNHMHYLGVSQTIEQVRDGETLRYITNDATYSYDSPQTHKYSDPIEVLPGDEFKTKCYYKSLSRTTTTVFGDSTQAEMCFGFLYYYPENAANDNSCNTIGANLSFCDEGSLKGCDPDSFNNHFIEYLYNNIVNNCTNHGRCFKECKDAISEARKTEPCMQHVDYWEMVKRDLLPYETGILFLGSIASCEKELVMDSLGDRCEGTGTGSTAGFSNHLLILVLLALLLSLQ